MPESRSIAGMELALAHNAPICKLILRIALPALGLCLAGAPQLAPAQEFCQSCEVQVGLGGTYHYWGTTGSLVLPVSLTWSDNRWELAAFRFTNEQLLPFPGTHRERRIADPYWGVSLSRRWRLFEHGPVQGYFGFGLAGRSASDDVSVTHWDFAEQLGLRFHLPGNRVVGEVTLRHWSNGGIRLPNHGQDFATVTFRLNSGIFGIGKMDYQPFRIDRALMANALEAESLP
jgi:Lipid A 3-O-deacylase (PagL)